jgi:hypothetical protein
MTTQRAEVKAIGSAAEHGYSFVTAPGVSVISITAPREPNQPFDGALGACVDELRQRLHAWRALVPSHRLVLFASTPFWTAPNAVQKRRALWGSDESLAWTRSAVSRTELEVTEPRGSRFAGVVQVPEQELLKAADYARTHDAAVLLFSPEAELSENRVRSLFTRAFPRGGSGSDWSALVLHCASSDDVVIKVSGAFDDVELAIDVFLSSALCVRLGTQAPS